MSTPPNKTVVSASLSYPKDFRAKVPLDTLITDTLLARALSILLDIVDEDSLIRARTMREKAGFTLCEAIQIVGYLQQNGVLQHEVNGQRVLSRELAHDYLAIISDEVSPMHSPVEMASLFPQSHIAWACYLYASNWLTRTRLVRPSRKTREMAQALGLLSQDSKHDSISMEQTDRLREYVLQMSEQERSDALHWGQLQFQAWQSEAPAKKTSGAGNEQTLAIDVTHAKASST